MIKATQGIIASFLLMNVVVTAGDAPVPTWRSATVKEPINVVKIKRSNGRETDAPKGTLVTGDDLLLTGRKSMVDTLFDDNKNGIRLGERTKFTFSADTHEFRVPDGLSLLTVSNGALTCVGCSLKAVLGSTAFIECFSTTNGPAGRTHCTTKIIVLEGGATVWALNNMSQSKKLRGGQLLIYSDDQDKLPEPEEVDVKRLVEESRIITAFQSLLPSMDKIEKVIDEQQRDLWRGKLERSRYTIGGRGKDRYVDPLPGRTDLEAPYDPDLPGGIIIGNIPCALCP